MGWLDWLKGRPEKAAERAVPPLQAMQGMAPKPVSVTEMGEDSPYLGVDIGNGTLMIIDKDMYDYQYVPNTRPDPTQRDLDQLMGEVTRVVVRHGGMLRGEALESDALVDVTDREAIAGLGRALAIVEAPETFSHCGCLGGPTMELYCGEERMAVIGLQHGRAIRWAKWKHDAALRNGAHVATWLKAQGLNPDLLEMAYQNHAAMRPAPWLRGKAGGVLSREEQNVLLAEIARQGGNLKGALALCDEVLGRDNSVGLAYRVRAELGMARGKHAECIADATDAIARGCEDGGVYFLRAVALDEMGRSVEALEDASVAVERDPKSAAVWNTRGLIRLKLRKLAEAKRDLEQALALLPDWELPHLNMAMAAMMEGDNSGAISHYDRAIPLIEKRRRDADKGMLGRLYWNRGKCFEALGDVEKAGTDLRKAVEICPELAGGPGR